MVYESIRYETPEEHVVAITLERPERLNALTGPLLDELADAVARVMADDSVRVFLLTGAPRPDGRPCFGGGVDLRAFAEGIGVSEEQGFALTNAIDDLLKPSIAVIDGICTTGAAELAMACDFRLVGAAVRISDWHLKNLGTGLGSWGASTRWARLVGTTRAKEIILTGKELDAEEAVRSGFATARHASAELWEAALEMARSIAGMNPAGVRLALAHLQRVEEVGRDEALRLAQRLPGWLGVSVEIEGKATAVLGARERSS
ncbi:MAG: enoyl-CoA hydratase/isomerase family protein [Deltaproteobacteria bacterium]|nr:enoyl-CoA hydratase/isomerase family protein [Deltaproteobacteria bacterium]MBW2361022.1 enoyl-CoA hydratase/isomerase family protein [Deltaproteobacteria bacterium]